MLNTLVIIGTRPEAIKMAPVILELNKRKATHKVVVTAQHREMLDEALKVFNIKPDYDFNIMQHNQTLSDISINVFRKIRMVYRKEKPSLVLVQGDTLTSFIACLSAFYEKIPIGHIEAGLRTYKKYYPFPEEMDRQLIDVLSDFYFVPTDQAKKNLLKEGKDKKRIFVTGNTVVDALLTISKKKYEFSNDRLRKLNFVKHKVILVETHRREIWGETMEKIHHGLKMLVENNQDSFIIFPVHKNPVIRRSAQKHLSNHPRILLVDTLNYMDLIKLLKNIYLIITDSGGLQEEAPTFGIPVLIVREETERLEGIRSGFAKLVGLNPQNITKETEKLIKNKNYYSAMTSKGNPYGDGSAAKRIVDIIFKHQTQINFIN